MVGNEERFLMDYKPFMERYDEHMGGCFASIGELVLPSEHISSYNQLALVLTVSIQSTI